MSNYQQLFSQLPWPTVVGMITAWAIPYLAQLATKSPTWATTAVAAALAFVQAIFVQLSESDFNNLKWKVVIGLAVAYTADAWAHHRLFIHGSDKVQPWLISHGYKPANVTPPPASASQVA